MAEEKITYNLDDELAKDEATKTEETTIATAKRPYLEWSVAGTTYKLKLTTGMIDKLERTLGDSLLNAVLDNGIPKLGVVIAIIQGAMQKYQHGVKSKTVEDLLDTYFDSGKTQIDLLQEVIYELMFDAGFFTRAQMEVITKEIGEIDTTL